MIAEFTEYLQVKITPEMYELLFSSSQEMGQTMSAWVRDAIAEKARKQQETE